MVLTQTAEYAFRAMACLAGLEAGESLRAGEISARTGVPVHYLSKVMRRLVTARLVSSQRGHHGGFSLARPAAAIMFRDVLRAVGCDDDAPRCAFGWSRCNAAAPCPMHDAWSELRAQFEAWADAHALSTIKPRSPDELTPRPKRRLPVSPKRAR